LTELRTLGALDLRGSDGRELRAILAQPKRLALLAYLAAATPGPFHRRDTLLALFWPDRDLARARASLSRAVHYLRASLGEGVLLSRGDEELGLAPDRFACDAVRFRELLGRDQLAEALELYRGDFLEGFHLSDAPELERWIEGERRQLRESAADAARSVSQSAESRGDLALALHWARQAASYAPYDEADVRRVLALLERLGERAAAVEYFQRFARRLRDELELEPSADTVALLAAITAAPQDAAPGPDPVSAWGAAPAPAPRPVTAQQPVAASVPRDQSRSYRRAAALAALTVVVLAVAALGGSLARSVAVDDVPPAEERPSIAVLPLANLSPDTSDQYFSDGMTDELIAALSQVEGLRVAARTSSFVYKNRSLPVRDIARALNVGAVLEGSARQDGDRVRITLQLARAPEGYTLWSRTYERERRDVFALQHEISRDVAEALKLRLVGGGTPARARTTDPETYDLYLWGRYHWNSRTREGLVKAAEFFARAAARDSTYAPAYAGLADSYNLLAVYDQPALEIMPKAKAAALRALELDETQSEAHAAVAYVATWCDWEWDTAERHFRRALELNPSNATAHHWYSIYLAATGRQGEALAEMDRARELDPAALFLRGATGVRLFMAREYGRAVRQLEPALALGSDALPASQWLGLAYLELGRVDEAIALLEGARATAVNGPAVLAALAMAYGAAGREADARAVVQALEARAREGYVPRSWLARSYAALGERERALMWLERAYEERDGWLTFAKVDPTLDALRGEPRFQAVLARMGLP
jgi:TolB-like protein/DNA-binding SARP family transcriptional activator/Tfp pilus assembly protein PilF